MIILILIITIIIADLIINNFAIIIVIFFNFQIGPPSPGGVAEGERPRRVRGPEGPEGEEATSSLFFFFFFTLPLHVRSFFSLGKCPRGIVVVGRGYGPPKFDRLRLSGVML